MKICIIIVTFNAKNWIDKCFEDVKDVPKGCQVVVVDNSSKDDTVEYLKNHYPNFKIIESEKNLGFGKANNLGFEFALCQGFEYFLLLNQDASINWDSILEMANILENNQDYGIVSPIHLTSTGDVDYLQIQTFCQYKYEFFNDLVIHKSLKDIYDIGYTNAAIWLITRQCLSKVGGFDPLFPHYGEDNDYCLRVRKNNLKVGLAPKLFGYHFRVQNQVKSQTRKYKYYIDFLLEIKHADGNQLVIFFRIIRKVFSELFRNPSHLYQSSNIISDFLILITNWIVIQKSRSPNNTNYRYLNIN